MLEDARAIRFSKTINDRIAKYRDKFHKKTGVELDFSTAVRTLVEQALTAAEKK